MSVDEQNRHIEFKVKPAIVGAKVVDAVDVEQSNTGQNGILASANNQQEVNNRLDATGIGSSPRTFQDSFFASWGTNGNQNTWYGGRQTVYLIGQSSNNANRVFELPDITELNNMFDDLASRGLGEIFTLTIEFNGGNSNSIVRNSMTIRAPSVSALFDRNEIPVTFGRGAFVTFRITRTGTSIGQWERVAVGQAADPVATFGEVVIQTAGWNNFDNSFLPSGSMVQKGYAFPVIGSNPNDGTLRQGLLDGGVSDRVIYNNDYVVWTADTFTSWNDGNNWFVINRNSLQRMSREQSNFLAQTSEIDNRVEVAPINALGSEGVVWVSDNPFAEAPFINPSSDTNNPRTGDDYAYVGGRENRDASGLNFQLGSNRFNNYLTVGVTPNFITAHPESDIRIRVRDTDRNIINDFNLATDLTFIDDATFTNSTYRHYQRSTSFNYPFLATIEVVLTQVQRHFRLDPNTVDVSKNVRNLTEASFSIDVQEKLNRAIPPQGVTYASIENRLSPYANVTNRSPEVSARFFASDGTEQYPSGFNDFIPVPANNPVFEATQTILFIAVPEPGSFVLENLTASTEVALDNATPNVEVIQSFTHEDVSYFVYRVTGLTVGNRFEVIKTTSQQVVAWQNSIDNLNGDIDRIDAELKHAALNLPDALVDVLDNEVTVTEQSNPVIVATDYNNQLAGISNTTQTVFYEPNPVAANGGLKNSQSLSDLSGDQQRKKLLYIPPSTPVNQASYITAFDGTTGRDLISYINGEYLVNVRVPAQPAGSTTNTIYPAPATRVSGAGIWQNIPALTFVDGVPVPEADELFLTRNVPANSVPITVQYRGHANGNIFGAGTFILAANQLVATVNISDGSETATLEITRFSAGEIRASVTERVNTGLPTINDVQVILSYTETINIPATPGTTRQVRIGNASDTWKVFAFKAATNGNLAVVSDETEIDTNRTFETWFGSTLGGNISIADEQSVFLNYEDFEPITPTVTSLENHATLPQFGLFTTQYTHETLVNFDTQLTARDSGGNQKNVFSLIQNVSGTLVEANIVSNGSGGYMIDFTEL